jgi:hypothetical protein
MLSASAGDAPGRSRPAAICENCGEAVHVYFCPKPPDISADAWQKMSDDERLDAERTTVVVVTVEMTGGDVRVEFHPTKPEPPCLSARRVVIRRAGEQLARDWFTSLTDQPRAQDVAYYVEKHIAAPIARTGLAHDDPHQRPALHHAVWAAAPDSASRVSPRRVV